MTRGVVRLQSIAYDQGVVRLQNIAHDRGGGGVLFGGQKKFSAFGAIGIISLRWTFRSFLGLS